MVIGEAGRAVHSHPSLSWNWNERYLLRRYPIIAKALRCREVTFIADPGLDGKKRIMGLSPSGRTG